MCCKKRNKTKQRKTQYFSTLYFHKCGKFYFKKENNIRIRKDYNYYFLGDAYFIGSKSLVIKVDSHEGNRPKYLYFVQGGKSLYR